MQYGLRTSNIKIERQKDMDQAPFQLQNPRHLAQSNAKIPARNLKIEFKKLLL